MHLIYIQGVPEKVSHSWEPKKLGSSYSETKHLLDLKLRQQRDLMSTPCSQSLRPNRCVVSEYEVSNSGMIATEITYIGEWAFTQYRRNAQFLSKI